MPALLGAWPPRPGVQLAFGQVGEADADGGQASVVRLHDVAPGAFTQNSRGGQRGWVSLRCHAQVAHSTRIQHILFDQPSL